MLKMRYASLCLLLAAPALPGFATTVSSTTYQNWTTNVSGSPTFEDVEMLPINNYSSMAGVSEGSYIFTGPDGSGWSLQEQTFGSTSGLYGASDGTGGIEVTLPGSGLSAIYFQTNTVKSNQLSSGSLVLTLSDGEKFNISSGQFGLSISHTITSYELTTTSGQAPFLQWAYFGNSSLPPDNNGSGGDAPASEAATVALVAGGLLVLFGAKRKIARMLACS